MTALTEARHDAGFILSEANGHLSRESGTAGGTVRAGELIKLSTGSIVSYNGSGTVVGIAINAAVSGELVAYIARLAEVNGNLLYSTEDTDGLVHVGGTAGLTTLNIIIRS